MMSAMEAQEERWDVLVDVGELSGDDDGEAAALARRLRSELLDLDVATVEQLTAHDFPERAKGLSAFLGMLGVRLGAAGLKTVVAKVRDWAARNGRTVEVTIDGDTLKLTKASPEEQDRLVNAWLARHGAGL